MCRSFFFYVFVKMLKKCCIKICKRASYGGCGILFHNSQQRIFKYLYTNHHTFGGRLQMSPLLASIPPDVKR